MTERRGVVQFEALPVYDGSRWDATAAERRVREWAGGEEDINWSKYRRAFAWFDTEKADTFGAYKLLHHDVRDGRLVTHRRGVIAAMGAVLGARGGVDIPETERRGVYNHLARHYKQFDMEPPEFHAVAAEDLERRVWQHGTDLRIERRDDGHPVIAGYAAVFEPAEADLGLFIERIRRGAFSRAIEEGQDVRALFNHDPNHVLGRRSAGTLRLREDDRGLWFEVDPPDTQMGRDVVAMIERGDVTGCSFSFRVRGEEWAESASDGPTVRIITSADLYDVGPVTFPAYPDTSVAVRSLETWRRRRAGHGRPDVLKRKLDLLNLEG